MKSVDMVLRQHFPMIESLQDIQQPTIDNILQGKNTLCLMPTGGGKSLVYQIAGKALEKTTIVISPLIALINQQNDDLNGMNLSSMSLHQLSGSPKKYYSAIGEMFGQRKYDFVFISPERLTTDGYLEHILWQNRKEIGLVVIDEAHCVSQWGHSFRTSYKMLPEQLRRIFGEKIPLILCLTATLNKKDQEEIKKDYDIHDNDVFQSSSLRREDLSISIQHYENEEHKKIALTQLLLSTKDQKTIIYVHRKYGEYGTKKMADEYARMGLSCSYFDADASDTHKSEVLDGFISGRIKHVFATSAFGMGINIKDIRRVIHYLMPESSEQYYQEIGRAGRDRKGAECLLMFTETNLKVRKDIIQKSIPTTDAVQETYTKNIVSGSSGIGTMNVWEDLADEDNEKACWFYLLRESVFRIIGKGFRRINAFESMKKSPELFRSYVEASRTGLAITVAKNMGISIHDLMRSIFEMIEHNQIAVARSPEKAVFYEQGSALSEDILTTLQATFEDQMNYRLAQFNKFQEAINNPSVFKNIIYAQLDI